MFVWKTKHCCTNVYIQLERFVEFIYKKNTQQCSQVNTALCLYGCIWRNCITIFIAIRKNELKIPTQGCCNWIYPTLHFKFFWIRILNSMKKSTTLKTCSFLRITHGNTYTHWEMLFCAFFSIVSLLWWVYEYIRGKFLKLRLDSTVE